ncbi:MAG: NAD(P)H-hydrate dehydratase [Cytophagales bacterium]|nr:NAD(P)H-hydrate dehydratase [Cytophagales bacterium]
MIVALQNNPALWQAQLPQLAPSGNKYTRGYALIMGGYPLTGASRLAARAAARMGAGLVSIAVPEIALPIYAASLLSIMALPFQTLEDCDALMQDIRITAMLIGAGIKPCMDAKAQTLAMLAKHQPTVLDAGALVAFSDRPKSLWDAIHSPCVLTPHEGEFAQLFGAIPHIDERLIRVCEAAKTSNAIVVLKGAETLIAAPNGHIIISSHAPPNLATAGSGDVLGGMIVGLLAQGMPAFEAASAAVWLHGAAAHLFGAGLLAEDLPDLLPQAMQDVS